MERTSFKRLDPYLLIFLGGILVMDRTASIPAGWRTSALALAAALGVIPPAVAAWRGIHKRRWLDVIEAVALLGMLASGEWRETVLVALILAAARIADRLAIRGADKRPTTPAEAVPEEPRFAGSFAKVYLFAALALAGAAFALTLDPPMVLSVALVMGANGTARAMADAGPSGVTRADLALWLLAIVGGLALVILGIAGPAAAAAYGAAAGILPWSIAMKKAAGAGRDR